MIRRRIHAKVDPEEWKLAVAAFSKPTSIMNLQQQRDACDHSIQQSEKNIDQYDKYIEQQQAAIKAQMVKVKNILSQIRELKKKDGKTYLKPFEIAMDQAKQSDRVDWLFLTPRGEVIVQTKLLTAFDARTNKDTGEPVGRFALYFNLTNMTWAAQQMDFAQKNSSYGTVRHPNFGNQQTTCWGINGEAIRKMLVLGNLHGAIEELINFVSYFPQDGHSVIPYKSWLKEKQIDFLANPWENLEVLCIAGTKRKSHKKIGATA